MVDESVLRKESTQKCERVSKIQQNRKIKSSLLCGILILIVKLLIWKNQKDKKCFATSVLCYMSFTSIVSLFHISHIAVYKNVAVIL